MKLHFVLTILVCGAHALTVQEAAKFKNSGSYGGSVSYTDNGDTITLRSNGLPDHPFEKVNPNEMRSRSDVYTLPKNPKIGDSPGCLSMGPIGMAITGALIFDPLDAQGENAVEGPGREQFDNYGGHTDPQGIYHYHKIMGSWLYKGEEDELLGVALDGFPIYGPRASDLGRDVTNQDLDECHGRIVNGHYRYHVNTEFPYYLGCYKGSSVNGARTTFGSCTNTSALSEYGYVCACARNGPGMMNHQPNNMHQPMNNQQQQHFQPPMNNQQQNNMHQPMNNQQQHFQPPTNQQQNNMQQPMSNQQTRPPLNSQRPPINQQYFGSPVNNQQQNNMHQPMNNQPTRPPMDGQRPPMYNHNHHHFLPPMDNQQQNNMHQPTNNQQQQMYPYQPDQQQHQRPPPQDGYPFGPRGPHSFGTLFGKK